MSKVLDIVERLRSVLHNDRSVELMNHEAAYEIEQLRSELTERIHMCDMRSEKIIELTAERDEIRLSYCLLMEAYRGGDGRVTANKLGWGYLFAEDSK